MRQWFSLVAFAWLPVASSAQQLEVIHVKGNVYLIAGAGANITMQVGDQAVVLVDSGLAACAQFGAPLTDTAADAYLRHS